ncbi:MAG TPA: V-type ATPase 116kDa subunit family protein, partial [Thermoplasmata archaeon]|nr:V-type ATPase 116kDa subunit family protein [Thermoplasmata archaeon]
MPFLRPVPFSKVAVIALNDDREVVLSVLHDLGVIQVEPVSKEALEQFGPERASELQRQVADQLVRFRGLLAALPATSTGAPFAFENVESLFAAARTVPIDEEVGRLKREEDQLLTERRTLEETTDLLTRFSFYTGRFNDLSAQSAVGLLGEGTAEAVASWRAATPALRGVPITIQPAQKKTVRFLVAVATTEIEAVTRTAQANGVRLVGAPKLEGTAAEEIPRMRQRLAEVDGRLGEIRTRLTEIARDWYPRVVALTEAFDIENRKLDVHSRLGTSQSAFTLEGWVPKRNVPQLTSALLTAVSDRAAIFEIPTQEEPPTFMENKRGIRRYEFFIRFYSLPQATEWDPTWTFAVIFPILFGFMLGDVGYAVVILGICIWMIYGFPGRTGLPKGLRSFLTRIMGPSSMQKLAYALVPGCLVGIGVGVLTNSYFGFALGYTAVFSPLKDTAQLLLFAGYLGLGMVLFGFILGALKEYFHHRPRHAWAKVGGILASLGLVGFGLSLLRGQLTSAHEIVWAGSLVVLFVGVGLMFYGEGVNGVMLGFIEVLSHILSYTRIVGILLASVILALVI